MKQPHYDFRPGKVPDSNPGPKFDWVLISVLVLAGIMCVAALLIARFGNA